MLLMFTDVPVVVSLVRCTDEDLKVPTLAALSAVTAYCF